MEGYFRDCRCVGLKDAIFLPPLLVFLLYSNKRVPFLGLGAELVSAQASSQVHPKKLLTPFNSFVLDIVAASIAFAASSTAAILILKFPESSNYDVSLRRVAPIDYEYYVSQRASTMEAVWDRQN